MSLFYILEIELFYILRLKTTKEEIGSKLYTKY